MSYHSAYSPLLAMALSSHHHWQCWLTEQVMEAPTSNCQPLPKHHHQSAIAKVPLPKCWSRITHWRQASMLVKIMDLDVGPILDPSWTPFIAQEATDMWLKVLHQEVQSLLKDILCSRLSCWWWPLGLKCPSDEKLPSTDCVSQCFWIRKDYPKIIWIQLSPKFLRITITCLTFTWLIWVAHYTLYTMCIRLIVTNEDMFMTA